MEKKPDSNPASLRLIIEEVDAAREVHQLFQQLQKALPIKKFDDFKKAADDKGNLHFRDASVKYTFFQNYIPEFLFPIEDEKALITRLAQFVKLMPAHIGHDHEKPENLKKFAQLQFLSAFFGRANIGSILSQNVSKASESNVQEFIKKNNK